MNNNTLDIVIPFYGEKGRLTDLLDSIKMNTDARYRLIVFIDQPGHDLREVARVWLDESHKGKPAVLAQSSQTLGHTRAIIRAMEQRGPRPSEYTVIVHPSLILNDKDWLTKLSTPFQDRNAFISYGDPFIRPNMNRPAAVDRTVFPPVGMTMVRRAVASDFPDNDPKNPWRDAAAKAHKDGRKVYIVPSLRISLLPTIEPKLKAGRQDPKVEVAISR